MIQSIIQINENFRAELGIKCLNQGIIKYIHYQHDLLQ